MSVDTSGGDPVLGRFHERLGDGRVRCTLCPRECELRDGQRGFCYIRQCAGDAIWLTSYGRASGFCIDPVEKKPLYHFLPGTSVLSFGTAGCNLGCRFCQNWDISKARSMDRLQANASPIGIAETALAWKCRSVAFTYNDPVVFAEYAIDTAKACRERNVRTVAVTAGYISQGARVPFFEFIDAANVDLKAITPEFYRKVCAADLESVKRTLRYLVCETSIWVELTTLLIPTYNDSPEEIAVLARWVKDELGIGIPVHFSAFHPDYRMLDVPGTPASTCMRARDIAREVGLKYVYTGNIDDSKGQTTYCPECQKEVLVRRGYDVREAEFNNGQCRACGCAIDGHFDSGGIGTFGTRRIPVEVLSSRV
ncbi:MAG TPA: AmmeMemoRadiSam system radical SAM enzyme [Polyangiaceae bacterium]